MSDRGPNQRRRRRHRSHGQDRQQHQSRGQGGNRQGRQRQHRHAGEHATAPGGERSSQSAYRRRYGSREPRGERAQGFGGDHHGVKQGGRVSDRAYGDRRHVEADGHQGNPRTGSQRGDDSVQGVAGQAGGQFGDLHGDRPTASEARGYHAEMQFGGDAGRSAHDRRYGSRRGHGSQRREDPRTRHGASR